MRYGTHANLFRTLSTINTIILAPLFLQLKRSIDLIHFHSRLFPFLFQYYDHDFMIRYDGVINSPAIILLRDPIPAIEFPAILLFLFVSRRIGCDGPYFLWTEGSRIGEVGHIRRRRRDPSK